MRQRQSQHACEAARGHDKRKGHGKRPDRPSAHLCAPDAYGEHRQKMIGTRQGMLESLTEAACLSLDDMRERAAAGQQDERYREGENRREATPYPCHESRFPMADFVSSGEAPMTALTYCSLSGRAKSHKADRRSARR